MTIKAKGAPQALGTEKLLRAAGVKWDLRKAQPYSGYEKYDFEIPTRQNGDTYDRYIVRLASPALTLGGGEVRLLDLTAASIGGL